MKRLVVIALILFSASGYASKDNLDSLARGLLQEILSDADSAKFLGLESNRSCIWGKVNAKNNQGGYVGFKVFTVTIPSKGDRPEYAEAAPGSIAYLAMCVSKTSAYEQCIVTFSKTGDTSFCNRYKD